MSAAQRTSARLSRRARRIEVSPTVAMGAARDGAARRRAWPVLDFSVGEPDQTTPRPVAQVAAQARHRAATRATRRPPASPSCARRWPSATRPTSACAFAPEEVVVTNGGKHALYSACQCLLDPGDEVIIPSPFWPTFTDAVKLAGGRPVIVQTRERDAFRVTPALVRKALTRQDRARSSSTRRRTPPAR